MDPGPILKPSWFGSGLAPGVSTFLAIVDDVSTKGARVSSGPSADVRVDVWLWAVRIFRTRTQATEACSSGKVYINDATAKASKTVKSGDQVRVKVGKGWERRLEVVDTPRKRIGAALASEALIDHSPPRPTRRARPNNAPPAQRDAGSGRPTKRDRRQMDRFRGR